MKSKRRHEGYLLVDHRAAHHGFFELATITCSHCQAVMVLNLDRTRERGYCAGCDHYICDTCTAVRQKTGVCRTFNQIADEALERAVRGK